MKRHDKFLFNMRNKSESSKNKLTQTITPATETIPPVKVSLSFECDHHVFRVGNIVDIKLVHEVLDLSNINGPSVYGYTGRIAKIKGKKIVLDISKEFKGKKLWILYEEIASITRNDTILDNVVIGDWEA